MKRPALWRRILRWLTDRFTRTEMIVTNGSRVYYVNRSGQVVHEETLLEYKARLTRHV